ncbi:hypothetical protein BD770DRAFT_460426, partial [Pilaira anomala]
MDALNKHVTRKHPDAKNRECTPDYFPQEEKGDDIPFTSGNGELEMHYYDPNVEQDTAEESSSDEEEGSADMSDDEVVSSDEEEGDSSSYAQYEIDEAFLLNTIIPISQNFQRQTMNFAPNTADEDINRLRYATSQMEQVEHIPDLPNPFVSPVEGLFHAFFYGDEDLCSERMIKKIRYLIKCALKLQRMSASKL